MKRMDYWLWLSVRDPEVIFLGSDEFYDEHDFIYIQ